MRKPDYEQDNLKLYNADCMDILKQTPDKYYDLCLVDPPYGIGADKAQNAGREKWGYKQYKTTDWDSSIPEDEYFDELFRISKKQIIWGGNYFSYIWTYSNSFLIWNKMQRDFSLADGELAWYSETNKAMRIFDLSRGGALSDNKKKRW